MPRYQRVQPKPPEPPPPQRIDPEVFGEIFGEDFFLQKGVTPEEFDILLANPEWATLVNQYLALKELVAPSPEQIEAEGWERWLRTIGPRTFTGTFSNFHAHLWEWYWDITRKRKAKEKLTDDELVFLAFWARSF